jgi:hypothetical protein
MKSDPPLIARFDRHVCCGYEHHIGGEVRLWPKALTAEPEPDGAFCLVSEAQQYSRSLERLDP